VITQAIRSLSAGLEGATKQSSHVLGVRICLVFQGASAVAAQCSISSSVACSVSTNSKNLGNLVLFRSDSP